MMPSNCPICRGRCPECRICYCDANVNMFCACHEELEALAVDADGDLPLDDEPDSTDDLLADWHLGDEEPL